jgi:hypothetical protein
MVLRYVRNCIAIAAAAAFVGLAVGGHALHDVTCDHGHPAIPSTAPKPDVDCEQHCHHHHGHSHTAARGEATQRRVPHDDHDYPSHPRHDHDCLICHFAALNMAIVADAVELPETPRDLSSVAVVVPLQTIYQPFGGNPRAPPA